MILCALSVVIMTVELLIEDIAIKSCRLEKVVRVSMNPDPNAQAVPDDAMHSPDSSGCKRFYELFGNGLSAHGTLPFPETKRFDSSTSQSAVRSFDRLSVSHVLGPL
jgi:hypothetical protein